MFFVINNRNTRIIILYSLVFNLCSPQIIVNHINVIMLAYILTGIFETKPKLVVEKNIARMCLTGLDRRLTKKFD